MKNSKASIQVKIKKLSLEKNVPSNVILQSYFFDAFIKRVAKSKYSTQFIFKGGFLLSMNLGINYRSTMDMDFLLKNISFEKEKIKNIIVEIININVGDLVQFDFYDILDIRGSDQYGGYRILLTGKLENIKVSVKIDVATGDPVTPAAISYNYHCLFDDKTFNFQSYNYETIIAEKMQTILYRGIINSRSKDFYDLYTIYKIRFSQINKTVLSQAFKKTCKYRKTTFTFKDAIEIIDVLSGDKNIIARWRSYSNKHDFAHDIQFEDVLHAILEIIKIIYNE